jgi:hypothetical protein
MMRGRILERMLRRGAVGVVLAALCGASPAAAASLEVLAPSVCEPEEDLRFQIEQTLGMPLAEAAGLHITVSIVREGSRYAAHLEVVEHPDAAGKQRVLTAPDCATLVDTVGIAVALALSVVEREPGEPSQAIGSETSRAGSGTEWRAADVAPLAAEPRPSAASRSASNGLAPALSAWFLVDVGSLPAPSVGAALVAQLGWRRIQLLAVGMLLFDQSVSSANPVAPDAGATLGFAGGGLLGCWLVSDGAATVALRACLGAEAAWLSGAGTGISVQRRAGIPWLAPRVDFAALMGIPETPLRLGLWLTAAAPLNRDEFAIDGVGRVHRPPGVIGRGAFGAEVRFQ